MWHVTRDICHVTCDMWHIIHDMWHLTYDMWQGENLTLTFQLPSSYDFGMKVCWQYFHKGWVFYFNKLHMFVEQPGYTGSVNNCYKWLVIPGTGLIRKQSCRNLSCPIPPVWSGDKGKEHGTREKKGEFGYSKHPNMTHRSLDKAEMDQNSVTFNQFKFHLIGSFLACRS